MWFIDKLNVHQDYDFDLPIVGKHMVSRVDIQTGEPVSDSPNSLAVEGSYSTTVSVRCTGRRIQITGNPSRWQRTNNFFGFTTFADCIQVYNSVLLKQGLPPLTPATFRKYRQGEDGSKAQIVTDGAVIDHVDFTRNLSVGKDNELAFLKGLSSQQIGKGKYPHLYPNGQTVEWYSGSTYLYKKVYRKAHDLIDKMKKNLKNASREDVSHYHKLIDFCDQKGVLREEHSFKREWLRRKGLNVYGMATEADFLPYLGDIAQIVDRCVFLPTVNAHFSQA